MEGGDSRRSRKPINYAEFADSNVIEEDFDDDFKTTSKSKKDKSKDKTEKVNGEERKDDRERRHSRDRHKEHKKHKDKDRDRHSRDKDRHRERHTGEDGERKDDHRSRHERKRKEHDKERRHRSERKDDKSIDDSGRSEGSSDTKYDSSDSQRIIDSSATSTSTASPLVSPSRRNPKPRLSLEEKMFQRELEVALELSKTETVQSSINTPEVKEHTEDKEETSLDVQAPPSPKCPQRDSAEDSLSVPSQNSEDTGKAVSSIPDESSAAVFEQDKDKLPEPPVVAEVPQVPPLKITIQRSDLMEPQPSTSTGLGLKRTRKTVNFKEDSDSSDDFDGFDYNSADSDASEESDFMPSPKKKKQKVKESKKAIKTSKQTKTKACKSSAKTPEKSKPANQVSSPPISRQKNKPAQVSSPEICHQSAKENTAPTSPTIRPPPAARSTLTSKVSALPQSTVSSVSPKAPLSKASTTKNSTSVAKPVKRPLINTQSSPSSGTSSISLVKTPFRSPLTNSPGSGHSINSASSVGSRSLAQRGGTRLRLGLSRRAIIKPLHPSVAAKITD